MNNKLIVVDGIPNSIGWVPIKDMVNLCVDLCDAELIQVDPLPQLSKARKTLSLFTPRRRETHKPDALFVITSMSDIWAMYKIPGWRQRFNRVYLWIIDSFNEELIPMMFNRRHFEGIFITTGNDLGIYAQRANANTQFLGWGADVLARGSGDSERDIDVLRIGRQPDTWEDDETNLGSFQKLGINYHGRPPRDTQGETSNTDVVLHYCSRAKYVVAHSNLVDSSQYTHPSKEYITGRWMDALASGCSVAGVQPTSDFAYTALLWPEATVELESTDLPHGCTQLQQELESWSPALPKLNYLRSLENLDWRWRFLKIANELQLSFPKLNSSIEDLNLAIEKAQAAIKACDSHGNSN